MTQGASTLRYVGSPYQTSLSEAGQIKYFYNMASAPFLHDSSNDKRNSTFLQYSRNWREAERWPISFGRKYFKVKLMAFQHPRNITVDHRRNQLMIMKLSRPPPPMIVSLFLFELAKILLRTHYCKF